MKMQEITTRSAEETRKIAGEFILEFLSGSGMDEGKAKPGLAKTICLWGDLGSGKTTFAQGVAMALGIKGVVNSPTFLIMKKYPLASKNRKIKATHPVASGDTPLERGITLYHFDMYRIHDAREVLDLGWKEILEDENNLMLVEWPEKIASALPAERIDIKFESLSENMHRITFHS